MSAEQLKKSLKQKAETRKKEKKRLFKLFRCKVFKGNSIKTLHFLQSVSRIAWEADIQSMPLNAKPAVLQVFKIL